MKKLLSVVLCLTMALSLLAFGASAEEKVKLVLWDSLTSETDNEAIKKMNDLFMAEHPNVTIERVVKTTDVLSETLKAAFMSGNGPDVIYGEAGIGDDGDYVKAGYLLNLNDAYEQYGWNDKLVAASKDVPSANGFVWGVGHEVETMSLYYNKTLFDELGLEAPKTVEELTECLKVAVENGYYGLSNCLDSRWYNNMNFLGTILYAFMSQEEIDKCMNEDASWDMESVRNAVALVKNWLDNGYFPDHPEVDGDQDAMFCNSEAACIVTGNWAIQKMVANCDFEVGLIPFPASETCADGGSQVNFVGGCYLVNAASAHQNIALEYIDFMSANAETAKIWVEDSMKVPPYTGEYDAEVTELMNTVIGFLADENLNNVPGVNMWVAANAWEFFSTAGQKMAIGAMDVDGFIAELDAAVAKDVEECGTKATFTY
ncbi:MAG: extracellular solute-binding protein [Clostridiales bacterium]|nr:extracellular solute-binding protein [Clostridiales bacterium]